MPPRRGVKIPVRRGVRLLRRRPVRRPYFRRPVSYRQRLAYIRRRKALLIARALRRRFPFYRRVLRYAGYPRRRR